MTAIDPTQGIGQLPPELLKVLGFPASGAPVTMAPSPAPGSGAPPIPPGPTNAFAATGQPLGTRLPPIKQSFGDKLGNTLNSPITQLGLNLLANSGPSLAPQSFGSALGAAGLATQQQQQQFASNQLANQLLEARAGLSNAQANALTNPRAPLPTADPASVRTFKYFESLGDPKNPDVFTEAQKRFLTTLRGQDVIDLPGEGLVNPDTREVVVPEEDLAAATTKRTVDKAEAGAQAEAVTQLSGAANQLVQNVDNITELRNHPGLSGSVGFKGKEQFFGLRDKPLAGTDEASFNARLDQLLGGAFLEAFETLKGGGQITEIEAAKAEQAITRLRDVNQSEEEWLDALDDYEQAIRDGFAKLQSEARGEFGISDKAQQAIDAL